MKRITLFIFMAFFQMTVICVQSQSLHLSLQESMEIAADSSLQAFIAQNAYQASYWEYRSYKAARLPSLTLQMTPIRYNRDFTTRYDSENNIDVYRKQQSLYSHGNLSISQNLDFTGGTFFIDSELGYFRNFGINNYFQFNTVPIRIGYSQSLFGFNSFKWERRVEPLKFEKAKRQYLYSREEISLSAIHYFFSLAMAQTEYELALENVSSTDTLYHIGNERFKIAAISHADLLTLKLDAINARNTLKNAEISLARAMFSFISFLNLDKELYIKLELPQRPESIFVSVDQALEYARKNNPDYLSYKQELLEAEEEVEYTKKNSAFNASVSASFGFNQVADNFRNAYHNPLQQDIASIYLTIPLIDWGVRKGRANMAKNTLNVKKYLLNKKKRLWKKILL